MLSRPPCVPQRLAGIACLGRLAGFAVGFGLPGSPFRLAVVAGALALARAPAGRAGPLPSGVRMVVVIDVESRDIVVVTDVEVPGTVVRS